MAGASNRSTTRRLFHCVCVCVCECRCVPITIHRVEYNGFIYAEWAFRTTTVLNALLTNLNSTQRKNKNIFVIYILLVGLLAGWLDCLPFAVTFLHCFGTHDMHSTFPFHCSMCVDCDCDDEQQTCRLHAKLNETFISMRYNIAVKFQADRELHRIVS